MRAPRSPELETWEDGVNRFLGRSARSSKELKSWAANINQDHTLPNRGGLDKKARATNLFTTGDQSIHIPMLQSKIRDVKLCKPLSSSRNRI
jgi:hypothetical protein